jgi:hypothetical protein
MGPIERGGMFLVHLEDAKKRMEHRGQHRGPQPSGPAVPAQHPPGADRCPTRACSREPLWRRGRGLTAPTTSGAPPWGRGHCQRAVAPPAPVGVRCAAISEEPPGAPLCDESEGESESRGERRTRKDISRGYTVKISGG